MHHLTPAADLPGEALEPIEVPAPEPVVWHRPEPVNPLNPADLTGIGHWCTEYIGAGW